MKDKNTLFTRDWLAIELTKFVIERSFLAYFRTFIVFLCTGLTILKIEFFSDLKTFGIALLTSSPIILSIGIIRLFKAKQSIKKYYKI